MPRYICMHISFFINFYNSTLLLPAFLKIVVFTSQAHVSPCVLSLY